MLRLLICSTAVVCGTAFAAPPADTLHSAAAFGAGSSTAAAPNQVFPPLPPLASLPPSANGDDDVAAPAGIRRAKKSRHASSKRAPEIQTQAHLVVTDESRAALAAVDKKLDEVLEQGARDRRATGNGAAAIAMSP